MPLLLSIESTISINLVFGENGILQRTRDGRNNYQVAANEETVVLVGGEDLIDSWIDGSGGGPSGSTWTYNHADQTVTNGTLTMKIGDYVNDTSNSVSGFDGKWRVLGAENGKLLLVTNTCWAPFEGADTSKGASYPALKLEGLDGWNNGVANLKAVGEAYANSSSKFEDGRSINK